MKKILTALCLSLAIAGCKKESAVNIDDKNLSACQEGADCRYTVHEKSAIIPDRIEVGGGKSRVFEFRSVKGFENTVVLVEAPGNKTSFTLGVNELRKGKVAFGFSCATCLLAVRPTEIIGGSIKGVNIGAASAGKSGRWLLDVYVLRKVIGGGPADTLSFRLKQYFEPAR